MIVRIIESTLSALPTDGEMILRPLPQKLPSQVSKSGDGKMEKMGSGEFFQHLTDRKVSQARIFQSFRD